ncbi:MAG: hypothetical protein GEV11_25155 [Streptosporangiales bacterium]|nr:hypothetical protein [Streptosporangiales bacterium]
MPSPQHDRANDLVRERPGLAVRLFRQFGGVELPRGPLLRGEEGELPDRVSTTHYADTIITDGPPRCSWKASRSTRW